MSTNSHAATIRSLVSQHERWDLGYEALDALLAENQRLRDALEILEGKLGWYENTSSQGRSRLVGEAAEIAREALAGDAE